MADRELPFHLPKLSLRAKGVATLTVPMLALFSALLAICLAENEARKADLIVVRAYDTRESLLQFHISLLNAETAATGDLAIRQDRFLASFKSAEASLRQTLNRLSLLVRDDSASLSALDQIERLSKDELTLLGDLSGPSRLSRADALGRSKTLIGEIESQLAVMKEAQQLRLMRAFYNLDAAREHLFRVVIICGIVGPLGALFVNLLITGRTVRRLRVVGENARRLAVGLPLAPSPEGTDEIADLARQQQEAAHLLWARERELRESERRYRELFERAPIPYDEIDSDGVVRRVNQAVCALLKCSSKEVVGGKAWDFLYPEAQDAYRKSILERISAGAETEPYECDYVLSDGLRLRVEVRENILRDEQDRPIGVGRSLLDVTERHLAELAARKVDEVSLELHNKVEELAAALDAARAAGAAKTRFLAGFSHELRTPLNAIIGFSELLYDGKLGEVSEQQREILGDVLSSAHHLLRLINDILDISKLEAGKMKCRLEPVNIANLVNEVRDVVQPLADKKRIRLLSAAPPDLAVLTDAMRCKQVLYNYLSNGVKFTPEGGQVTVRVNPDLDGMFRVEVEDTGIGIAPDEIPQLFQEFQQLSAGRKADQSTGLGLALTRRIVEALGGRVEVRSVKGKGSVFSALLPISPAI